MPISRTTFALVALATGIALAGCGGNDDERAFKGRWKSSDWGDPMTLTVNFRSRDGDRIADLKLERLGSTYTMELPEPVTIRDNALYMQTMFGEMTMMSIEDGRLIYDVVEWSR